MLTSLYNVALNPKCSLQFRIVITKQLLKQFISTSALSLRFIAKFSFSCFHRILSTSEVKQLALDNIEVDMLARCLNGVDNFFGGFECLLLTVSNLASFPNNWVLFTNGGVVQILMTLALSESGPTQIYAVRALLNMIPEPLIAEPHIQTVASCSKSMYMKPLTNPATMIFTKSPTFMEFVRTYESAGVCGDLLLGIKLLTIALEKPGKYIKVLPKLVIPIVCMPVASF